MKFFAVLAAASIAIVSAETPNCDTAGLVKIAGGANGAACLTETQYSPATLQIPTGDALVKVCSNKNCQALLGEMSKAITSECLFSGVPVKSTLLDKFGPACAAALKSVTTTAPTTTTAAPSATTAAPGATTAAPATTKPATTAPATTKPAATNSTTTAATNTTSAPAATTKAPMPETTGSGSMGEETAGSIESADPIESAGSIDEVATVTTKAPASTTAAPKASSGASIATAAGVVVAAVVASLF